MMMIRVRFTLSKDHSNGKSKRNDGSRHPALQGYLRGDTLFERHHQPRRIPLAHAAATPPLTAQPSSAPTSTRSPRPLRMAADTTLALFTCVAALRIVDLYLSGGEVGLSETTLSDTQQRGRHRHSSCRKQPLTGSSDTLSSVTRSLATILVGATGRSASP